MAESEPYSHSILDNSHLGSRESVKPLIRAVPQRARVLPGLSRGGAVVYYTFPQGHMGEGKAREPAHSFRLHGDLLSSSS